jgi:hypothetical protein
MSQAVIGPSVEPSFHAGNSLDNDSSPRLSPLDQHHDPDETDDNRQQRKPRQLIHIALLSETSA